MKKIHKIREWFSLSEAADRLSDTIGDHIDRDDLIKLALEGHINLFWYMRHQPAVEVEYARSQVQSLKEPRHNIPVEGLFPVNPDGQITFLEGPFSIPLEYQGALADYLRFDFYGFDDPEKRLVSVDGYYVKDNLERIWNLQERYGAEHLKAANRDPNDPSEYMSSYLLASNYFPSGDRPQKAQLGFTRQELERFERSMGTGENNALSSRERQTLLRMIIGMAKDAYGYDSNASRSPFPKELEGVLDELGISVSDDTIRKWLKEAAELLPQDSNKN